MTSESNPWNILYRMMVVHENATDARPAQNLIIKTLDKVCVKVTQTGLVIKKIKLITKINGLFWLLM